MSNLSATLSGVNRLLSGTSGALVVRPNLAASVAVVTSTSAWTYGAWSEIVAASDLTGHMLVGIWLFDEGGAAIEYQVQIGEGGAGSEAVISTVPWRREALANVANTHYIPLLRKVTASARVAARATSGNANTEDISVKCVFLPRPA